MSTQTTKELVDQLHNAGLQVTVKENGNLVLTPSERLNDELRGLIRANKTALVDYLKSANDEWRVTIPPGTSASTIAKFRAASLALDAAIIAAGGDLRLPPEPRYRPQSVPVEATPPPPKAKPQALPNEDWKVIYRAYMLHHLNCPTCQAAGRSARYDTRCTTGAALWMQYDNTNTPTTHSSKTTK